MAKKKKTKKDIDKALKEYRKKYPYLPASMDEDGNLYDAEGYGIDRTYGKLYEEGGKFKGPSHKEGGIPIEVEGGEYIIKKDSVNAKTEPILEKINKTGKLSYACGGKIPIIDARKRSKK